MARILLAEDEPFINRMLCLRLSLQGHEVVSVTNGQEALERALEGGMDLILMDMHMPVMDGHQATVALRDAGYRGKIIAVTASAMRDDCQKAMASGCNAHISKPVGEDFEQIIAGFVE